MSGDGKGPCGAFRVRYLRCVSPCLLRDGIEEGDLLWKRSVEVRGGGREYAVLIRRGDLRVFRVALDRLDRHFEVEEVDETPEWVRRNLTPATMGSGRVL